jgi:hypothetical protein
MGVFGAAITQRNRIRSRSADPRWAPITRSRPCFRGSWSATRARKFNYLRERLAQIEAIKNLIRDGIRELETWTQHRDHAAKQGMTKQAQFRQQMITGMEKQLKRYKEELRQLQSIPGSSWSGST